jgi:AraC-like DNA-binding protein
MQVHHKNFGSKTALRCGYLEGIYDYPSHIHQFPEIIYVKEGGLILTVDGEDEEMHAGDIAIISPFRVHGFRTPNWVNRWVGVFSGDFIANFITNEEFYGIAESCVFSASDELKAYIEKHLLDSEELFFSLSDEVIRTSKAVIFAIYEEYLRKAGKIEKRKYRYALSSILLYISEHYREPISLASIGSALGYSPKYVSLCLAEIDGMNLLYLVNSFRADYAKTLLANTKATVLDVALECGYANERSFYRAFSQVTGMTPGQYRRSKRTFATPDNEEDYYPNLYDKKKKKRING